MRVLLVEPDPITSRSIELLLTHARLHVYCADTMDEGVEYGRLYDYDFIISELNFSEGSGFDLIQSLRNERIRTPIMILTNDSCTESLVKALTLGADEYLTKPVHRDELVARIQTIVRRAHGHQSMTIRVGRITINLDDRVMMVNGKVVHLTNKEYQLCELLFLRKGVVITREMFLNHLYGGMDEPDMKIIDVFVSRLRKKLAAYNDGESYIEGVWGHGYVLREPKSKMAAD